MMVSKREPDPPPPTTTTTSGPQLDARLYPIHSITISARLMLSLFFYRNWEAFELVIFKAANTREKTARRQTYKTLRPVHYAHRCCVNRPQRNQQASTQTKQARDQPTPRRAHPTCLYQATPTLSCSRGRGSDQRTAQGATASHPEQQPVSANPFAENTIRGSQHFSLSNPPAGPDCGSVAVHNMRR